VGRRGIWGSEKWGHVPRWLLAASVPWVDTLVAALAALFDGMARHQLCLIDYVVAFFP
jgi:hypothetical protein